MDADFLKKVLSDNRELASLPQTLAEVLRVTRDDRSSAQDMASVIMKDPALTARVLRIVNSAYYGLGRQIGSISQSIMTIGMRQVSALALSSSVYKMTDNWNSGFDRRLFWRHSLEVAIAARMLAEHVRWKNVEEPWVAGLLHDIGLLVLERSYPKEFARIWSVAQREGALEDHEVAQWNTDHARVGKFMLQQWNLPESICVAVGYHHMTFTPNDTDPDRQLTQIVCLAHLLSRHTFGKGPDVNESDVEHKYIIAANLGIGKDALKEIEKQVFSRTITEAQYLEIDIGSSEELLMEANQHLMDQYLVLESLLGENRHMHTLMAKDQLAGASFDSLRRTTLVFSQYLADAVELVSTRTLAVKGALEAGTIIDTGNTLRPSLQEMLAGLSAMRTLVTEILSITSSQSAEPRDPSYVRAVESRVKNQLAALSDTAGVSTPAR